MGAGCCKVRFLPNPNLPAANNHPSTGSKFQANRGAYIGQHLVIADKASPLNGLQNPAFHDESDGKPVNGKPISGGWQRPNLTVPPLSPTTKGSTPVPPPRKKRRSRPPPPQPPARAHSPVKNIPKEVTVQADTILGPSHTLELPRMSKASSVHSLPDYEQNSQTLQRRSSSVSLPDSANNAQPFPEGLIPKFKFQLPKSDVISVNLSGDPASRASPKLHPADSAPSQDGAIISFESSRQASFSLGCWNDSKDDASLSHAEINGAEKKEPKETDGNNNVGEQKLEIALSTNIGDGVSLSKESDTDGEDVMWASAQSNQPSVPTDRIEGNKGETEADGAAVAGTTKTSPSNTLYLLSPKQWKPVSDTLRTFDYTEKESSVTVLLQPSPSQTATRKAMSDFIIDSYCENNVSLLDVEKSAHKPGSSASSVTGSLGELEEDIYQLLTASKDKFEDGEESAESFESASMVITSPSEAVKPLPESTMMSSLELVKRQQEEYKMRKTETHN